MSKESVRLAALVKADKNNNPSPTSSLSDPDQDVVQRAVTLLLSFDPEVHDLGLHSWLRQMKDYVSNGNLPSLGQAYEVERLLNDPRPSSLADPAALGVRLPHQKRRRRRD